MKDSLVRAYSLFLCLSVIQIVGCASTGVYPISTGSHTKLNDCTKSPKRVVVWGNHPGMVNTIIEIFQRAKCPVVERARLQMILKEQEIRLTHTPEDEADLLRIGKLAGADHMIFAEAVTTSVISSGTFVNAYGGASRTDTAYHVSVSIRSVDVETGEIQWSGSAHYDAAISNPEGGIVYLTRSAVARATCPLEEGHQWSDSSGCSKPK
ncbi:MAG: CsgG/HfaB family protein [Nitrospira sp.]|nr:CsgG/HfaB family protein [Nitrospira sp.]